MCFIDVTVMEIIHLLQCKMLEKVFFIFLHTTYFGFIHVLALSWHFNYENVIKFQSSHEDLRVEIFSFLYR
jgi:hypothetical protein